MKRWTGLVAVLVFAGCSNPSTPPIRFSSTKTAADALAQFDTNTDGRLDAEELKSCPALAFGLAEIDTDKDKTLSLAELKARVEQYGSGGVSIRDVPVRVVRGGKGVANVTVTLEPEPCMGDAIRPATALTAVTGDAMPKTAGQPYPGAQIGWYKIVLSQKDSAGKELLAARFNTATVFGVDVAPKNRIQIVIELNK